MAYLEAIGLCKAFQRQGGGVLTVLQELNFAVEAGEFVCLLGPSGCGKSTILNIIAGTLTPDGGLITVAEDGVRYGYVFQKPQLLPWRTVRGNLDFVMENIALSREERRRRASVLLDLVGLRGSEEQYPYALSGGMQQRVAVARALAIDPQVLLMDEPFSHLDELTARSMRFELLKIWETKRMTIIFVTHNAHEAVFLADRVITLTDKPARVGETIRVNIPRPRDYEDPAVVTVYKRIIETVAPERKG